MKTGNDRAVGGDTIRVAVDLGERSYPILIGADLLSGIGGRVRDLRPGARCAIVSDETVAALHGGTVRDSLAAAGVEFVEITVPAGEKSKSHRVLEGVLSQLLDARLERSDLVLALGGGVVGDLAGFAAAIYKRGMDFIQLPTTLLAQVDSSVGGKTGINAAQGKNLIGSFHQPILVLADIFPGARVLESGVGSGALSTALLRAGAHVTGYEIRDEFADVARSNVAGFLGTEALERYDVQLRSIYKGIDGGPYDRIVLDLPEPWHVVEHVEAGSNSALESGQQGFAIDHLGS